MDNLIQLAMQMIFCLLIASLLGAIIGYLLGKMSKCDNDDNDYDRGARTRELNSYDANYDRDTHVGDRASNNYNHDENIVSSGIDSTKTMAAAGIAGAGALGAGIVGGAKDLGHNVSNASGNLVDGAKDLGHRAGHMGENLVDGAKNAGNRVISTTDDVRDNISHSYNSANSLGQEVGVRPPSLQSPRGGEVDDLKEISGIGLKIEEVLNSLGIYHFDQISDWEPSQVEWIENYLSVKRRVLKEDWIGQARLLATGGQTEFSKKVRRGDNRNYQ